MEAAFIAIKPFLTVRDQSTVALAEACGLPLQAVREALTWAKVRGLVAFREHIYGATDKYYSLGSGK